MLPAAGVLVSLGAGSEFSEFLPNPSPTADGQPEGIDDPVGGVLAVKSRVVVERNPAVAVALARQVLDRKSVTLGWSRARHLLHAAHTLMLAADDRAGEAIQAALASVDNPRFRLLRMEAGLLAARLGISDPVVNEAKRLLGELDHELGSPEGFRERWLGESRL